MSPPLRAHAGVPVGHDGEAEPPLRAYKTPPSFSLVRPSNRAIRRPPAISVADDIAALLASLVPTRTPKHT
jgi:hypothetical protein